MSIIDCYGVRHLVSVMGSGTISRHFFKKHGSPDSEVLRGRLEDHEVKLTEIFFSFQLS